MNPKLQMPYLRTKRVPFEELIKRCTLPCAEVPYREVYPHKPLPKQGRFGSDYQEKNDLENKTIS